MKRLITPELLELALQRLATVSEAVDAARASARPAILKGDGEDLVLNKVTRLLGEIESELTFLILGGD